LIARGRVWLWALCGACSAASPDTSRAREAYLAVLTQPHIQPEPGLAACADISDPQLAGDCALFVVSVEARRRDGRPARWCEQVPDGVWRAECWFVAAEASKRSRKLAEAAAYCMEAGPFRNDCAQHLWQSEVHGLIHRRGPAAFGEQLPAAEALHDKWAPMLAESSDFGDRFWAKFYQNGFEGRGGRVDLTHCDSLSEPHRGRCVAAATELYARELAPRLSDGGLTICTLEVPEDGGWSAALVRWVPAQPDPRLDAVVSSRRQECDPAG